MPPSPGSSSTAGTGARPSPALRVCSNRSQSPFPAGDTTARWSGRPGLPISISGRIAPLGEKEPPSECERATTKVPLREALETVREPRRRVVPIRSRAARSPSPPARLPSAEAARPAAGRSSRAARAAPVRPGARPRPRARSTDRAPAALPRARLLVSPRRSARATDWSSAAAAQAAGRFRRSGARRKIAYGCP